MNSSVISSNGMTFTRTDYNGISVIMDEDGYYNGSKICADNGKRFSNWLRNDSTTRILEIASRNLGIPIDSMDTRIRASMESDGLPLLFKRSGGKGYNDTQGYYIHPKLVHHVSSWANLEYAWKVGEIMDLINERIHIQMISIEEEKQELQEQNDRLRDDNTMLMDENDALHENNKNLTNNVNELRTRAVPKNTNNKLLRILKRDGELYKITANSHWKDSVFTQEGYTIIRHFSFPASMNVRQKLLASEYVTRLYFAEGHLNDVYRIIRNEQPLNEW